VSIYNEFLKTNPEALWQNPAGLTVEEGLLQDVAVASLYTSALKRLGNRCS
jgi:hypothetical protein